MKKKGILIVFCTILVSVMSILVTTAYLTDTKTSDNTYQIGKVSIKLDESNVNELGELIDNSRVKENNYHLMPGYTYIKDPTITVLNNSLDSYIRILVTVNKINNLKEIYGDNFSLNDICNDLSSKWTYYGETLEDDKVIYEYRYNDIVNALNGNVKLEPLFKSFTIDESVTVEELETIKDLEIKIVGHAIQESGFNGADDAWLNFDGNL